MNEVPYDDLEPSKDCSTVLEYKGARFTGIAVEHDAGVRISETPYVNGLRSGLAREWSSTGQLLSERNFFLDVLHGRSRRWFEEGRQQSEATHELGICIVEQEWNSAGALIKEYRLTESHRQFKTLQRLREIYLKPKP